LAASLVLVAEPVFAPRYFVTLACRLFVHVSPQLPLTKFISGSVSSNTIASVRINNPAKPHDAEDAPPPRYFPLRRYFCSLFLAKHGLQEQEVGHALIISPPFDLGHVGLVEDGLDRHDVLLGSLRGAQSASEAALLCIGRSRHAGARVVVGRRRHYERPGEHDVRHRLLPPVRGAPERAEGGADSVRVRVV